MTVERERVFRRLGMAGDPAAGFGAPDAEIRRSRAVLSRRGRALVVVGCSITRFVVVPASVERPT